LPGLTKEALAANCEVEGGSALLPPVVHLSEQPW
jgi:hypothetical protein